MGCLGAMSDQVDARSQYTPEQQARDRRVLRIVVGVAVVVVLGLAQGVLNGVVLSDKADALDPSERRSIEAALQGIRGCSSPFSRLVELEPNEPGRSVARGFHYRCALTILGVPAVSGEADCSNGEWLVPGFRGMHTAGWCGDGDERRVRPGGVSAAGEAHQRARASGASRAALSGGAMVPGRIE